MSLTISPNPLSPSLRTKHTHNIFSKSPQISQNSIFTKPKNNIRVSASCPSSVLGNSANPFGKFGKVQCFLGSSLSHLRAQLSNFEAFGAVNGDFEVTMWALTDFIGSFWPRSVCEGYLFSTGNHAVVPAFLRPGLVNMNVRKSRVIVSAFNNPDRRLPKKEEQKMMHEGLITESLPNGMFRVQLDNKDMIIGYISGKMRKNFIRILPGDRVKVEVSRYDSTRGRIVLRIRNKSTSE